MVSGTKTRTLANTARVRHPRKSDPGKFWEVERVENANREIGVSRNYLPVVGAVTGVSF